MLLLAPILILGTAVFTSFASSKVRKTLQAYGQSAGYAEQALSSIKVVVAFGMELTEKETYARFLTNAKKVGSASSIGQGVGQGFFIFTVYCGYAYAFYIGALWVDKNMYNHAMGRHYTAGDSISIFFGVIFGMFSIVGSTSQLGAIIAGKAAARMAFDVIDRKPIIN